LGEAADDGVKDLTFLRDCNLLESSFFLDDDPFPEEELWRFFGDVDSSGDHVRIKEFAFLGDSDIFKFVFP